MKRILLVLFFILPLPAIADEAKVSISVSLLEEVFRSLSTQPYANVASTIAKLQAEVQQQKSAQVVLPPKENSDASKK